MYINNSLIIIDRIILILGYNLMKYVHIQSILPQEDVIALKKKTGKSSVKDAVAEAVYYYLKYGVNTNDK